MPQKDKATFVRILNKYLDPRWSDQDLADAVGVKERSTANRWKSADYPTMPQGETLDKLVQVLKITDEDDRNMLYGAAGYLAPPADTAGVNPPSIHAIIHHYFGSRGEQDGARELEHYVRQYLAWVQETYGRVTLRGVRRGGSQLIELPLDDVYVPLTARMGAHLEDADGWPGTPAYGRRQQRRGGEVERLPLDQLLAYDTRLVVTGGPGCGKTTVRTQTAHRLLASKTWPAMSGVVSQRVRESRKHAR